MLKTVVEQKNVHGLLRFEPLALGKAVLPYPEGSAILQTKFHHFDFVARALRPAIAAAQNGHLLSFGEELFGQPDHHGRLAGAAGGQVANANDLGLQVLLFEPAFLVHPNTRVRAGAIEQ